jgi:hypothetical protein
MEAGGLPRTDYAGFGEEFNDLVSDLVRRRAAGKEGRLMASCRTS